MSSTTGARPRRHIYPTGYASLTTDSSDWGPARHDPDQPRDRDAEAGFGTALRDGDDALPDDN